MKQEQRIKYSWGDTIDTPIHRPRLTGNRLKIRSGPAGILIFDRTTGINVLFDEFVPPTDDWAKAPRQVSIALTNACDLSCTHCYAPKHAARLPLERLKTWLLELDRNDCIGVGFGGGDPTLYPHLARLCEYAHSQTNMAVTMTTHGHRLDDRLLAELEGNLDFVRISMDGTGETYERIRQRSFEALLKRIDAVRSKLLFGINYLVNAATIGDIGEAVKLASELGASEFLLLPESPVGKGKRIDDATLVVFKEWVRMYEGPVPLTVSEYGAEGLPTCDPFEKETGIMAYLHIDASGQVRRNSYEQAGILISETGIIEAIKKLQIKDKGEIR